MNTESLYISHGITNVDHMNIENIADTFNIILLKDFPFDVRVSFDDIDIIMLKSNNIYSMTETFFHELAHVFQHGHTHINNEYRKYCEGQANKLMYELAVPEFMLPTNMYDYAYIQYNFNVSKKFALRRVEQLKNEYIKRSN
ncbi:ImmA/IrrE family metallo-endopeptidase [Macrococcus equipercicus]|uniref:ImmA/IrrE family metallo-endopeptidase n=1 Tax=Macrococcus equipercicus TaxID=69967 RepID=A0A9Q9BUS1_9STAP|nr:ImmA/IrrE family metallo-endopeptidase [Macrococcus equipercicus]UTH13328.1 ImmA/IrrE family metallo-endopeptidase [Macrococcus equipercicus]